MESTLQTFLGAFSRLDIEGMLSCFSEDATAFFPVEHRSTRMEGRPAIGEAFSRVLKRVRDAGATRLKLDAEDLIVQRFGDVAVATFHIYGGDLSRRTVVLRNHGGTWLIVHLHASNAPIDRQGAKP